MHPTTPNAARLLAALVVVLASVVAGAPAASADDEAPSDPTSTTSTPPPTTTTSTPTTTITPTTTTTPPPPATAAATPPPATTQARTPVAPTPAPAPRSVTVLPSQIANILATIRYLESRGNYTAPPNRGRASGAYQFITSTWNNYAGYRDAYLAPPEIQDERAAADVTRFLAQWNNDVSMIPVMWYLPSAATNPERMDIVPVPSAGNVLTVREYQQRWLGVWATMSGQPIPPAYTSGSSGLVPGVARPTSGDQLSRIGFAPDVPAAPIAAVSSTDASSAPAQRLATVAFPLLGPTRVAAPDCSDVPNSTLDADASTSTDTDTDTDIDTDTDTTADPGSSLRADAEAAGLCAQAAPGIIFGVKLQPVLAPVDGVVTEVRNELGGVISVTITDATGRSYRLDGFNDDSPGTNDGAAPEHLRLTGLAEFGRTVRAGQILGFVGDSSPLPLGIRADVPTDATVDLPVDAVAPHIRLTITDLDGSAVDAYGPVIDAVFRQACSVGIGPWSGLPNGTDHPPVTIETTDDSDAIDSEWVITPTGEVNASGWAAMIYPSEACGWAPDDKRGPGAGGPTMVPDAWKNSIDLYTPIWVELAVRSNQHTPVRVLRP